MTAPSWECMNKVCLWNQKTGMLLKIRACILLDVSKPHVVWKVVKELFDNASSKSSPWGGKESDMTERLNWRVYKKDMPGPCPLDFIPIEIILGAIRKVCSKTQRRQWHPTPVLLPGKSHWGEKKKTSLKKVVCVCLYVCSRLRGNNEKFEKHGIIHCNSRPSIQILPSRFYLSQSSISRPWHPTPVLLPGKSHGWRSLVGCSPWGR